MIAVIIGIALLPLAATTIMGIGYITLSISVGILRTILGDK